MPRIIDVTTVYAEGRTQIPKPVRDLLKLGNGDKLVWSEDNGKVVIEKAGRGT